MEFQRECVACEQPAISSSDRCAECGEPIPQTMVALRGAESARQLNAVGLSVRSAVLLAMTIACTAAFLSGIRSTSVMSPRLSTIELIGYFTLRAIGPGTFALVLGVGTWMSLRSLFGRGHLREAIRLVATVEGVWVSSDSNEYPKERRPWSTLKEVRAEAKGRYVLVQAIRRSSDTPVDLLWRRHATANEAEGEASELRSRFAVLQRSAPPEAVTDEAQPPHTP